MPEPRAGPSSWQYGEMLPQGSASGLPQEASALGHTLLHPRACLRVSHVGRELGAPGGGWLRRWWPGGLGRPWRLDQEP